MYEYSEKKNREMGVLFRRGDSGDDIVYEDALREVESIIAASMAAQKLKSEHRNRYFAGKTDKVKIKPQKSGWVGAGEMLSSLIDDVVSDSKPRKKNFLLNSTKGYCIRCGQDIAFNPSRPYCYSCFSSWLQWENPAYIEKHCHACGKFDRSSMLYPLCHSCFQKSQGH